MFFYRQIHSVSILHVHILINMKKYIIIRNGLPTGGVRTAPYAGTLPAGASELEYRNTTRPAAQEGMRVYETFRIEGNVCFQAWRQVPVKAEFKAKAKAKAEAKTKVKVKLSEITTAAQRTDLLLKIATDLGYVEK
jgi:hypothetical protein